MQLVQQRRLVSRRTHAGVSSFALLSISHHLRAPHSCRCGRTDALVVHSQVGLIASHTVLLALVVQEKAPKL